MARDREVAVVVLASLMLVSACSSSVSDEEVEDLEETIAVDLDHMFETLSETAASVAALDATTSSTGEDCWDYTDSCEACSSYEGTSGAGTFTASLTELPCAEVLENDAVTRTYTFEESTLSGTWTGGDQATLDWTVEGEQRVEYVVETERAADRVYDASWSLDSLVAATIDGALGDYELSATYGGYVDLTTRLDIGGFGDQGEGSVVFEDDDNDQVICTFSRDGEIVTILCD